MKVAVIGAGIVGVTTAYELVADGHEVKVFERRGSVAAEASFAHAGIASLANAAPWAAAGMPGGALRSWFGRHRAVRVRHDASVAALAWMWRSWRGSRARAGQANVLRLQRLAAFNHERLRTIRRDLKLDFECAEGQLLLMRSAADLARWQPRLESLRQLGARIDMLDARQCLVVEPGLNPEATLHAGVYLPDAEVGNCREFAHLLRAEAQRLGARFRFHTDVQTIRPGREPQLIYLSTPPDSSRLAAASEAQDTRPMALPPITEDFDAIVVCAAVGSDALLRPLGLKLPMLGLHGCSVTAPLRQREDHPDIGPRSALLDVHHQVTISRIGGRVRACGGFEIGGSPTRPDAGTLATLYKVLHDWFPGAARLTHAQPWKGARLTLPDGPPVLGRSQLDGVWLNLGHGSNGWGQACGAARLLADALAGRPASIDIEGLGIERLRGAP